MGITLIFHAVPVSEFLALWLADDAPSFERVDALPSADFSLHLRYPDDLNDLWTCLNHIGVALSPTFAACTHEVWSNGVNEFVSSIHPPDVEQLARLRPEQILQGAEAWNGLYPELQGHPALDTATYHALHDLHRVAKIALQTHVSLLLLVMW